MPISSKPAHSRTDLPYLKQAVLLGATLGLGISLLFASCTSAPPPKAPPIPGPRVSVMTFNVENLFDTEHDEGTEDFTYLPLAKKTDPKIKAGCDLNTLDFRKKECLETDWNDDILNKKLARVADVIKQINEGKGPDILVMAEVENQKVLNKLRDNYLANSGYQTAKLIDSFDPRGIDPAVMSRFPMWREPKIHKIPLKANDKVGEYSATRTRGILEVPLTLPDGTKALVFAVHLPSQQNPVYLRAQAVDFINSLEKDLPPDVVAIVGGDFNITHDEDESTGFFKTILSKVWSVTHIEGCKDCEGSHYYHPKTEWSFLDALLVRRASSATTGWRLDPASVKVANQSKYQVNKYQSPARFDASAAIGVSDHWPVYAELVKPPPTPAAAK